MISNFLYPAVILDHSSHISSVGCSGEGLDICFIDGFLHSDLQKLWILTDSTPLILSSYFPGCGNSEAGMRSFWRATGITVSPNDERCVHVTAAEVLTEEAMSDAEVEWGSVNMDASPAGNRRDTLAWEPTVDISDDPDALSEFFGFNIDDTAPGNDEEDLEEIDEDGSNDDPKRSIVQKRGVIDWAEKTVKVCRHHPLWFITVRKGPFY